MFLRNRVMRRPSLFKEQCAQGSGNVAAVSKELATPCFDHRGNRLAIIDIAWGQTTRQQFALVIDRQMELEPKEPAHTALGIVVLSAIALEKAGFLKLWRKFLSREGCFSFLPCSVNSDIITNGTIVSSPQSQ